MLNSFLYIFVCNFEFFNAITIFTLRLMHLILYEKETDFFSLVAIYMFFMFVSCLYYYRNNEVRVDLQKKTDENVGFNIIGGNKYGIFVDSVEPWTPADKCNIPKFQKLLEVHFFIIIIITFFCIIA